MAEPGLSQRLRRHSRNSGMMIGVSMAAAMIICIAAFIWLYIQVGPLLSDFIPEDTGQDDGQGTTSVIGGPDSTPRADDDEDDELALAEIEPEPMGTPDASDDENEATGIDDEDEDEDDTTGAVEWEATHEIRDGPNVNFRSGPNTISEPQGALAPGTPLEFLGDEQPDGGVTWMYFEIEDGTQGWIRDIDVIEFEPEDDETDSG